MAKSIEGGGTLRLSWRPASLFVRVTSLTNSAGTLWIFALTFLICADVIARNFFGRPIAGTAELVGYSIVAAVYLQLPYALHTGRFTRAVMVIDSLARNRPAAAAVFNAVFSLLGAIVFALIARGTFAKLIEAWPDLRFGNVGTFSILVWPLRAVILGGAVLTSIEYLIQLRHSLGDFAQTIRQRRTAAAPQPIGWGAIGVLVLVVALVLLAATADLTRVEIGALSLLGIIVLICLGIHIATGLMVIGFVGIWIMMGDTLVAQNAIKLAANEFLRNYLFGVIPLFVLMGLLVNESGIGKDTFDVARWIMRPIKGGLGVATVFANAIFAAITGSSIASAAVFTKVATPHMLEHGYTARFAVGTVAGSSVLGMLIPPSLLLIIYAFVAEQSVGLLFLAAIVPGLILAVAMAAAIVGMAYLWPSYVGVPHKDDRATENVGSAALKLMPILILIGVVLGGIYSGLVTPVEAGGVGAMGALIIAVAKRSLSWQGLWNVLVETGKVSVSILFLILSANLYGRMLALSGLPQQTGDILATLDLGFYGFMALYVLVLVIFGMFLDSVSIMLIILPLVLTIVQGFGADLVWFGIVTVIVVEMGLLTPPLGLSCFVVKSVLNDDRVSLKDIFIGSAPFVVIMLVVTILLIAVPELSLVFL